MVNITYTAVNLKHSKHSKIGNVSILLNVMGEFLSNTQKHNGGKLNMIKLGRLGLIS